MVYYIPFIVIFQIGWASTQVSHLSIIPNLTYKENERTKLNSYRYGFTGMVYSHKVLISRFPGLSFKGFPVNFRPDF